MFGIDSTPSITLEAIKIALSQKIVLLSVTKITHSYIKHEQSVKNMECFMIWRIPKNSPGFQFLVLEAQTPQLSGAWKQDESCRTLTEGAPPCQSPPATAVCSPSGGAAVGTHPKAGFCGASWEECSATRTSSCGVGPPHHDCPEALSHCDGPLPSAHPPAPPRVISLAGNAERSFGRTGKD